MPRSSQSFASRSGFDRKLTGLARGAIAVYRLVLSPVLGQNCRFAPSCSQYADEALARFGIRKGVAMAVKRILRCHPWNPGGYDPVCPENGSQ